jgi:hypothetical protein
VDGIAEMVKVQVKMAREMPRFRLRLVLALVDAQALRSTLLGFDLAARCSTLHLGLPAVIFQQSLGLGSSCAETSAAEKFLAADTTGSRDEQPCVPWCCEPLISEKLCS